MITRDLQDRLLASLRWTWWTSLAAAVVWVAVGYALGWHHDPMTLEHWRVQTLLTCLGFAAGAAIAVRLAESLHLFRKSGRAGLVALLLAHVAFLLLVWTHLKTHPTLWRLWWIAIVATVTATHVMYLRLASYGRRGITEKIAIACALVVAALLAALALRKDILADWGTTFLVVGAVPAVVTVVASVVSWVRVQRHRFHGGLSRRQKAGLLVSATLATFAFGFYAGRVTTPPASEYDALPSALASVPRDELDQQVRADLARLRTLAVGLDQLHDRYAHLRTAIDDQRKAESRAYFTPAEDDQVRSAFMSYLAYRSALLRMVATYAGFSAVRDPDLRDRCFLVGYGAASAVLHASVTLVAENAGDDVVRRKLNEPDPRWGMPAGMFDRIYEAVGSERNTETYEEMAAYFAAHRTGWRDRHVLPTDDLAWLDARIDAALAAFRRRAISPSQALLDRVVRRVKSDAYSPVYATQSMVSTWIGDVRMVQREPFIAFDQIRAMQSQLRPGDILLERRNWFFSNAFLPGFWPHAAIYLGTPKDLEQLGLIAPDGSRGFTASDPEIRSRLADYLKPAPDGQPHTILESVSEGVIFNSLTESMHADYVAVLRPRLTDAQKAQAIARAFSHQGKPYDFEFDFFSSDKLVCTELVYRSYEGLLHFDLIHLMGRDTLPALEICRKFGHERPRPDRQLDFVLFLDTKPGATRATPATEADFITSADRPRGFNE
jgi:hypothetical protein